MIPTKKQQLMDARKEMFDKMERQLTAGRTPEDQSDELLDDINFHFNKVKCCKIERMMPQLDKLVEEEIRSMYDYADL